MPTNLPSPAQRPLPANRGGRRGVHVNTKKNFFLSLNPFYKIEKNKIIKEINFTHPYYDKAALDNQKRFAKAMIELEKLYIYIHLTVIYINQVIQIYL